MRDLLRQVGDRVVARVASFQGQPAGNLRICVLGFRTQLDRLEEGLEDIRAEAAELHG